MSGDSALREVELHRAILQDLGHELTARTVLLDFGCGAGALVHEYRAAGIDAQGADVHLDVPGPHLHQIPVPAYRLPFSDDMFDVVVSNSVLEHVKDITGALHEIHRVLKPGGASLHFFPPPARPIEPHVFVPLGGLVCAPWWLALWALLGIRNSYQRRLGWRETATRNRSYLITRTFYRSRHTLDAILTPLFDRVTFAERTMLRHSYGRARHLAPIAPLVASLYGACHQRCLFFEKHENGRRSGAWDRTRSQA